MTIAQITQPQFSSNITTGTSDLDDQFNSFLSLLTTQLKHQDPTEPLDTNQMTAQLVDFTALEQQLQTNEFMAALFLNTQHSAQTEAVSFIGKKITTEGNLAILQNSEATWSYRSPEAGTANIAIFDEDDTLVKSETIAIEPGQSSYTWNGVTDSGNKAPDGRYAIKITALNASNESMNITTEFTGIVDGVDFTSIDPELIIGDTRVVMSSVSSVSAV